MSVCGKTYGVHHIQRAYGRQNIQYLFAVDIAEASWLGTF